MRANEFLIEDNTVVTARPSQLSPQQLNDVSNLILQGGEVMPNTLAAGLQRAYLIGYATNEQGEIVAVSALKTPLDSYKTKVFAAAGHPELANQYRHERGLSYTNPDYRRQGLNRAIWEKLLASAGGKMYATTRSNNEASKNNLISQGFTQLGEPWASARGDYTLELWVR